MSKETWKTIKEYAWSSFVTFTVAFGLALTADTTIPLDKVALFAVLLTAARAGTRAVFNYLATKFKTISSRPE